MTTPSTTQGDDDAARLMDVWSRTTSKYRVRSVVLLLVNIVVFAGLCCFAFWVRQGRWLAPTVDGYGRLVWQTFLTVGGDATLANFVLFPIRVDLVPMHGVVVGLMLAALVSVPILISILYGFPSCLPFILSVALLGVMPWLAVTLLGACLLAGVKRLRFRFRYASALLGFILVLVYFYGASRQTPAAIDQIPPQDRLVFMGPWILATIAACGIMGAVLALAKWVNYRPGVVAPTLLAAFLVPMLLFVRYVGPDELYYRLVEHRMKERFAPQDLSKWFENASFRAWSVMPEPKPGYDAFRRRVDLKMQFELDAQMGFENAVVQSLAEAINECDLFLHRFPGSRYAANVLYLKASAMDTRVDRVAFARQKQLRFYTDFPANRSEHTWQMVVYNAPDTDLAVIGRYKLALLAARNRRIDEAKRLLGELVSRHDQDRGGEPDQPSVAGVLTPRRPDDTIEAPVEQTVVLARRLLALLEANANDPRYGNRPLCGSLPGEPQRYGWLQLDPRDANYRTNLLKIIADDGYKYCLLADNVCLAAGLLTTDPNARIGQLNQCLERYRNGDARPETLYRLGLAYQQAKRPAAARRTLEAMLQAFPDSPFWSDAARDRLAAIVPTHPEGTR